MSHNIDIYQFSLIFLTVSMFIFVSVSWMDRDGQKEEEERRE